MKSINYMDQKKRASNGVRFLRAENHMQVIDSMCGHPLWVLADDENAR